MSTRIPPFHLRFARVAKYPLFVIVLALWFGGRTQAQISPGPLSRAHEQLEGLTKCATCHEFGTTTRGFKCLGCHVEIRRRVDAQTGFHARNFKNTPGAIDCRRCHQEHKGQAAPLIRLDRQNFDHQAQTGFALVGKHREQKCASCHMAAKIPEAARAEIKQKDLNHSFLGLKRECLNCHKDQHQSQLGVDCLRCHNQDAFKPASGFNHSTTPFPLTGLHQTVACQKCHGPKPGQETAKFKDLPHNGCQSCHNDPHSGAFQDVKFRGSCDSCHNTGGFKANHPGSEFNHATTKFPLQGKHTAVVCSACHKGTNFRRPIQHERCQQCHEDQHKGQFATRAAGSDCASCHDVTGFRPTKFDRETHSKSAFPLVGKHTTLQCAECHQPEGRGTVFITGKLACAACHKDRHAGEFAAAPHSNNCGQCHTPEGFRPTTFTVARHAETQFPLAGRHADVACEKCHKPLPGAAATAAAAPDRNGAPPSVPKQFHFSSRACNSCHTDPHQTKLACETCHTPEQWKAVRPFEHPSDKFKIEGSHLDLKCAQCHKPSETAAAGTAKTAPHFAETPTRCVGCHIGKDPHGGQFKLGTEGDCSNCHVPAHWNGENFNHDKAPFILNQVHRDVACAKCHKDQKEVAGKKVRIYRGTPTECVKCH